MGRIGHAMRGEHLKGVASRQQVFVLTNKYYTIGYALLYLNKIIA